MLSKMVIFGSLTGTTFCQLLIREFESLFQSSNSSLLHSLGRDDTGVISENDNRGLLLIPSEGEIKEAVWSMHPLKAPRPDGFSGTFYRNYWSTIGDQIVKFVQECFRTRSIPKGINKTFIVLFPKLQ